jgi:putative Mg2+ transporter-C (MgtC) family protein
MPLHPSGSDIALRIALTLIAGAAIGYNREQHGRPAGLGGIEGPSLAPQASTR